MFQSQNTFHFNFLLCIIFFSPLKASLAHQCYKLQQLKTGFSGLIWKQSMGHMYEQKLIVIFFQSRISFLISSVHRHGFLLLFFLVPISKIWNRKSPVNLIWAILSLCSYTGCLKVWMDVLSIQGRRSQAYIQGIEHVQMLCDSRLRSTSIPSALSESRL